MKESNKVSNKQIRALLVSAVVGVGILRLPNQLAELIGKDGWIAILLGGFVIAMGIVIINKLFSLYPHKNFFQIGEEILGKWLFKIMLIAILVYLVTLMGSVSRNLGELLKAFLLETTPVEVMVLAFILATSYIARSEIQIIGRAAYHIYPIILGFILITLIVSLPNLDLTEIIPAFQSDLSKLPKAIEASFFSYLGFEVLLFSLPYSEDRKYALKSCLIGMGIIVVIYILVFLLCISQFGVHHLERQTFPTLAVIKEIDLPGYFIENLDGLAMAIWVLIVFGTMAPAYYSAGKVLSNLFGTREHELFILPLLPIIYVVALLPGNVVHLSNVLGKFINYSGFIAVFLLPILLYFIGRIKLRWNKR